MEVQREAVISSRNESIDFDFAQISEEDIHQQISSADEIVKEVIISFHIILCLKSRHQRIVWKKCL
jgi:hypothetical protein